MRYISNKLYTISAVALVVLVSVFAISTVRTAYATSEEPKSGERLLVVHDGTNERGFITKETTVRSALEGANITFGTTDLIEPSLDEELVASSYDINIYRARPVTIVDGAIHKKIMSAYRTPAQIVAHADMELRTEDKTEMSAAGNGAGIQLAITRATPFTLVLYGKKATVYTQAKTVGDMLEDKKIAIGKEDTLSVATDAPLVAGMTVELWRNGKQTVTEDKDIEFKVEQIQDADRPVGYKEVKTPGVLGKRSVTYEIEMKNGIEVGRTEIQSVVVAEPQTQIEVVGAKNNYSSSLNEWLYALRMCETHSNYQAATGNGYYGAYQFLPSTWNSIARRTGRADLVGVLPSQAAPADQDAMVIANTNATAGLSTQHPGCYKKLGLSNKPPAQ